MTSRTLAGLADEYGSLPAAWSWLSLQADLFQQPLAVSIPGSNPNRGTIAFLKPATWAEERFEGWVAGHMEELEALFGPGKIRAAVTPEEIPSRKIRKMESTKQVVDDELKRITEGLVSELRQLRPDLFDSTGRLLHGALERLISERTGQSHHLTKAEVLKLVRPNRRAVDGA